MACAVLLWRVRFESGRATRLARVARPRGLLLSRRSFASTARREGARRGGAAGRTTGRVQGPRLRGSMRRREQASYIAARRAETDFPLQQRHQRPARVGAIQVLREKSIRFAPPTLEKRLHRNRYHEIRSPPQRRQGQRLCNYGGRAPRPRTRLRVPARARGRGRGRGRLLLLPERAAARRRRASSTRVEERPPAVASIRRANH